MLEMLGVLAIVGVLSVGGIAGYSKAIEKFKVNKLLGEYNNLIMGLLEHRDNIINNMPGGMYLGNFVSSAILLRQIGNLKEFIWRTVSVIRFTLM
ncbi:MAG: hypothetical protein MR350_02200 [Alphaproteobacteria bacterium]|nr:hypothetical protein [Alphaproteobacteria bacterium]